ncbi:MAG: 4-hydroxy-tetrahydrodipicolinate reductase [Candidatus Omnitrophica bacterium]|jgi:4-hydroxy-tetrahydrodipicolinate reductase|nr:4-hydroxy-tetrahydrodipicolinate reductase [Candidatus Omnitrophota bacterium]
MVKRILIAGSCGRMGKRIAHYACKENDLEITAAVEAAGHPDIGKNYGSLVGEDGFCVQVTGDLSSCVKNCDVIIDFTSPSAMLSSLKAARETGLPIVIGVTGITDEEYKVIESSSKKIPVFFSSNMSIAVNVMYDIACEAAAALGDGYDIEIVEAHHKMKKDAPSGTAKTLLEKIAQAKGLKARDIAIYGRSGNTGARPKGQICVHAVRGGTITGEHTVIFAGEDEVIEITHRASSRDIFARGAIRAAKYIVDKSPGLYNMQNVIQGV